MADSSISLEDDKSWEEEFINALASRPREAVSPQREEDSRTHFTIEIPQKQQQQHQPRRMLHRVPPHMRANNHLYEPTVFSFGPYHRGRLSQFHEVEDCKTRALNSILKSTAKSKGFFFSKFLERADEIRHFYGGISKHDYTNNALAEMMLLDACFIFYGCFESMFVKDNYRCLSDQLGESAMALLQDRDWLILENQVPFWAIKLLISLTHEDDHQGVDQFLCKVLSFQCYWRFDLLTQLPWEEEGEPLHLLESVRVTLLKEQHEGNHNNGRCGRICSKIFKWIIGRHDDDGDVVVDRRNTSFDTNFDQLMNKAFRSVTDLKAKGIRFGPSSKCLKDIKFNSYGFYAKLQLPSLLITSNSNILFSNLIAFEVSPGADTDFEVTTYVSFMQSLIERPKDVKELREKGILLSTATDEQALKMFKELNTHGIDNFLIFRNIKKRIDDYCDSRAKTWMAELIHTYFRNPWSVMALIIAAILLCLTFLQTFYTMNPPK